MSIGTYASFTHEITEKDLAKVVGKKTCRAFYEALHDAENLFGFYGNEGEFDDGCQEVDRDDPVYKRFKKAMEKVQDTFEKKTGIGIYLCYHSEDCGDSADEVEGWYWEARFSDLFHETKAFKNLKALCGNQVAGRKFFTIFG